MKCTKTEHIFSVVFTYYMFNRFFFISTYINTVSSKETQDQVKTHLRDVLQYVLYCTAVKLHNPSLFYSFADFFPPIFKYSTAKCALSGQKEVRENLCVLVLRTSVS